MSNARQDSPYSCEAPPKANSHAGYRAFSRPAVDAARDGSKARAKGPYPSGTGITRSSNERRPSPGSPCARRRGTPPCARKCAAARFCSTFFPSSQPFLAIPEIPPFFGTVRGNRWPRANRHQLCPFYSKQLAVWSGSGTESVRGDGDSFTVTTVGKILQRQQQLGRLMLVQIGHQDRHDLPRIVAWPSPIDICAFVVGNLNCDGDAVL